ncbi:hypothetical protein V6N12_070546 [Hibiscus sabdariffa]|uniref:RNase H type-1 domain-containing protein n=1 Tax=Hibiscus sabdariffa TaxID=183260 RepID=A0ABR2FHB5_9ROSI
MVPHGSHTPLIAWQPPPTLACSLNVDASVNSSTSLSTVQSDSAQVIRLLYDFESPHCPFLLIDAISTLRDRNWKTEYIWIPREANMVADAMAKIQPPGDYTMTIFDSIPDSIRSLLIRDVEGPPYPRHTRIDLMD